MFLSISVLLLLYMQFVVTRRRVPPRPQAMLAQRAKRALGEVLGRRMQSTTQPSTADARFITALCWARPRKTILNSALFGQKACVLFYFAATDHGVTEYIIYIQPIKHKLILGSLSPFAAYNTR